MMDNNQHPKTASKGWSAKNIRMGGIFVALGFFTFIADIYTSFESGSPAVLPWVNLIGYTSYAIMLIGISGFWFIVPAFEKWWHTKKQWLAWIFLVVGIVIIPPLLFLLLEYLIVG